MAVMVFLFSKKLLFKVSLVVCIFISPFLVAGQDLETGKILDSIAVSNATGETFALYLPSSYKKDKSSPILFIMDPAARGAIGIDPFIEASEKYGHILVCSNNSKNGPYDRNFQIADNLFKHIFANFLIDEKQMYLTGFSGGSRLATTLACLSNQFAGVIGCGAGFSNTPEHIPSTQGFAYVGICGDKDMNYSEMINNKNYLERLNFNSTLITFDGNHRWPSRKEINRAFRWLALQRIKKQGGTDVVLGSLKEDYEETKQFENMGDVLFAAENYDRIIKTYGPVVPIDTIRENYKKLLHSKPFKSTYESLSSALELESKWSVKLIDRLLLDMENPNDVNLNWWKKEMEKLEKVKTKKGVEFEKMVERIKFSLYAITFEKGKSSIDLSKKIQAIIYP